MYLEESENRHKEGLKEMTRKKLSVFGIIVAGSLICLLMTAYVLIKTYDYNTLKPKIAHTVKQATHRELDIAGDIQLGLGLEPRLKVADVRFQNASWGSRADPLPPLCPHWRVRPKSG